MTKIVAAPSRRIDAYVTIDLATFVISIFLLGINYNQINNSFFTTVFILVISPCLRKIGAFLSGDIRLLNKKPYKITNIIELTLMIVISTVCVLGIFGVMTICKFENETAQLVKICVTEGYVFFSGVGCDLRVCMAALFLLMFLKIFNSFPESIVVE